MMCWWKTCVDDWAGRAKLSGAQCQSSGEQRNYSVPGAFGDAFGPLAGIFTAFAFAATVASAVMQRQEMKEARAQFASQFDAMKRANELAQEANALERLTCSVEAWRQVMEVESNALKIVEGIVNEANANTGHPPVGDAQEMWRSYWNGADGEKEKSPLHGKLALRGYAVHRAFLDMTLASIEQSADEDLSHEA